MGPLCLDLYLPGLPLLTVDLHSDIATAQLSLTMALIGLGVGQLVFGPLSDAAGRKRPLLFSLILFIAASFYCALAPDMYHFLLARLLQGLAGAGGAVLSRAIARDLYSGYALTRFFALLMLINSVAPIMGPVIGGAMLSIVSWHGIFVLLAGIGFVLLLLSLLSIPETLPEQRRIRGGLKTSLISFRQVMTHRVFMRFCLTQGFGVAGMFAYIGASPFFLQNLYHLTPQQYSLCFGMNALGLSAAIQLSSRLGSRFGEQKMIGFGLIATLISSVLLLVACTLLLNLTIVLATLFFTLFFSGMIGPLAASQAMQSQGDNAGSASALLGISMYGFGAVSAPLTSLGSQQAMSMAVVISGCYLCALLTFCIMRNTRKNIKTEC